MRSGLALLTFVVLAAFASGSADARDCRVPHLPGKSAVRPPPGCDWPGKPDEKARVKLQNGFIDLGNGTQVRISGRVRMDVGTRR
jgi:hypothetical protein